MIHVHFDTHLLIGSGINRCHWIGVAVGTCPDLSYGWFGKAAYFRTCIISCRVRIIYHQGILSFQTTSEIRKLSCGFCRFKIIDTCDDRFIRWHLYIIKIVTHIRCAGIHLKIKKQNYLTEDFPHTRLVGIFNGRNGQIKTQLLPLIGSGKRLCDNPVFTAPGIPFQLECDITNMIHPHFYTDFTTGGCVNGFCRCRICKTSCPYLSTRRFDVVSYL